MGQGGTGSDRPEAKAKRRGGTRHAGSLVGKLTRQALGKRGFAHASIITDWALIVGEDLSRHTRPLKLAFPKGRRNGGTVHIQTSGPMALQLQHLSPLILERINNHFGYKAVEEIRLVQGTIASEPGTKRPRGTRRELTQADRERIQATTDRIEDEDIRQRLERLGAAVFRHSSATKDR